MTPGALIRHEAYYSDTTTGAMRTKYLLVLAAPKAGDVVFRLLTSRQNDRPETPPCFHGMPYPGFFLGLIGGHLTKPSWLDLRASNDLDADYLDLHLRKGRATIVGTLDTPRLIAALECAAAADDTTRHQESMMRDVLAALR